MAGRPVFNGWVYVKIGVKGHYRRRYLTAKCGDVEHKPASLCFSEPTAKDDSKAFTVSFAKMNHFSYKMKDTKEIIEISYDGKELSFYAESIKDHEKWIKYCNLLNAIPNYSIPEEPNYKQKNNRIVKEFEKKYKDAGQLNATNIWIAFILNNGVGHDLDCQGLHIIAVCNGHSTIPDREDTFNIHDVHTGKCLHTWHKSQLTICGQNDSLVYLGGVRMGLLWMHCPNSDTSEMSEHLHRFIYGKYQASKIDCSLTTSIDSGIHSNASDFLKEDSAQLCNLLPLAIC
ncbi:uncharacterized protein [Dysidea avara]|uniref:uncharacterized protein n=1 Tax=Dysidea avara TaxID=196820 RepID=UPI003324E8F2